MKISNWIVRAVVTLTFFALLLSPEKWGWPLGLISGVVIGTWSILYPEGVLGWAKTAHSSLDVDDRSIWWLPRLIGCFFVFFAVLITLTMLWR
jgi:threonine/homoserine/homoserine lactone efflux protein